MTKADPPNLDAPWLQHYVPQFKEILRQLDLVEGFILVPIETYSPEVARALGEWLKRQGWQVSIIEPRDRASWELLAARLLQSSPGERGAVLVIGREAARPGEAAGLRLLNQRRDVVTHHLACPLLWCGPPAFHTRTWELTPDFWSIRAIGHRLKASSTLPAEHLQPDRMSYGDWTPDLLAREELEQLFAAARAQRDVTNTVRVALRLARVLRVHGDLDRATEILNAARDDLDRSVIEPQQRDWLSAAITGGLAEVLALRGELEEALRIWREQVLPVYERLGDKSGRAQTLGRIANVLQREGRLEEALRIQREEVLPLYERLGDEWWRAQTLDRIAEVLYARGEMEEALQILREEVLPVYQRLGDMRSRALTMGRIGDVLQARGQLDEALQIRRDEELPAYEQLGDEWSRALTLSRIADMLQAREQLEEALQIRRDEALPLYERLGDVRSRAVTLYKIANVLQALGKLDDALRIYEDEVLPAFERLGKGRDLLVRFHLARLYRRRGKPRDNARAAKLLRQALADATAMQRPEADAIRAFMAAHGVKP